MTPKYRFAELQKKGFCFQCLYPGADKNSGKHKDGPSQTDFVCKHPSHDKFSKKKHVLVCEEHSQTNENKQLLEEYKSKYILKQKANLPEYSKEIKLSFHASNSIHINNKLKQTIHATQPASDIQDKAIYILQTINVNNQQYNIFYDSGCGDMVSRYSAIKRLGRRAKQEYKGPVQLGGVGGVKAESKYGIYQVKLPLCSGSDAILSEVCLEKITESFPTYPLQGKVMQDIISSYKNTAGNPSDLPKVPVSVGGNIDFMIGIKYLRHHPKLIYQLPSRLSIYESMFKNSDGTRGVIGGPHEVFTKIEEQFRTNIRT